MAPAGVPNVITASRAGEAAAGPDRTSGSWPQMINPRPPWPAAELRDRSRFGGLAAPGNGRKYTQEWKYSVFST